LYIILLVVDLLTKTSDRNPNASQAHLAHQSKHCAQEFCVKTGASHCISVYAALTVCNVNQKIIAQVNNLLVLIIRIN
jgi:hypothetical protein